MKAGRRPSGRKRYSIRRNTPPNRIPGAEGHSLVHDLNVRWIPLSDLKPQTRKLRQHSDRQVRQLASSIDVVGWINPLIIDEHCNVLAGEGRRQAAILRKDSHVPVIQLNQMTNEQRRAYVIADNRLAELGAWDTETLAVELAELTTLDLSFNIESTGFVTAEIDQLIVNAGKPEPQSGQDDDIPEPTSPTVTRAGDLWLLGDDHKLLCGNSQQQRSFFMLMEQDRAQACISDVPYNRRQKDISVVNRHRHSDFRMASGEMSREEFEQFLTAYFRLVMRYSNPGALCLSFIDWRSLATLLAAAESQSLPYINLIVWQKSNAGLGSMWRSQHELIAVHKNGEHRHINNIDLGRYGRYRTNVWHAPGMNAFGVGRDEALETHPTVKPVTLIAEAIRDCTHRGGIVLDPFGGSGTAILAAERTGRRARVIEIEPKYADVSVRRWEQMTGRKALHARLGKTFDEIAVLRTESSEGGE